VSEQSGLDFAGLLRQLRERALLTQEELAEAAGLSPRAVSDLERGIHRTARKDTAVLLAGALGLDEPARQLFVAAALSRAPAGQVLAASNARLGASGGVGGRQAETQRSPEALAESPYRGLTALGEQDSGLFFGREAATAQVLERMAHLVAGPGVLVVSGVSGAGKSSLLAAGVLPQVRAAGLPGAPQAAWWPRVVFTPTRAPLDELALRVAPLAGLDAAAVRRGLDADPAGFALTARQAAQAELPGPTQDLDGSGGRDQPSRQQRRLVLVVDQFEELFTRCEQEGQRRAFITALHAAASTGYGPAHTPAALVVLGVRADFEARCADYPQLAGVVRDRYVVMPVTERQLRMVVIEPAKKAGSWVDADMVGVLLAEARSGGRGGPGSAVLPFISYVLDQAWRCRTEQALTLAAYERAGGIEGAVAASAEHAYGCLSPAQQAEARQVFLRLATIRGDDADTTDTVTKAELTEGKSPAQTRDITEVLEVFAAERLLTLAADGVAISHEMLLTAWPLLRDSWLADNHADRIVRTRLHHTAAEWARRARDPSYLYQGSLLTEAVGTATRIRAAPARHPPLSQTEHDFLRASDRARRHRARRRWALTAFLTAVIIVTSAVAWLAIHALHQAHQRAINISSLMIRLSESPDPANPVLPKLDSVEAWLFNPSQNARLAMLRAASSADKTLRPGETASSLPARSLTTLSGPELERYLCKMARRSATSVQWRRAVNDLPNRPCP
jgi:transcriptional regulator with XRE-family HTH domain